MLMEAFSEGEIGLTETGGIGALNGSGNRSDIGYSTLGMRAASYYLLQNGMAFIPRASVDRFLSNVAA